MRILIDADGCPVVDITIQLARKYKIEVILLCDTSHEFKREGIQTITVSKGADSVDFRLVNLLVSGDVVITQDYGLAAMCLARSARVLSQNGMEYTAENIDSLLYDRHMSRKMRMSKNHAKRIKGPKKRTEEQDRDFCRILVKVFENDKGDDPHL